MKVIIDVGEFYHNTKVREILPDGTEHDFEGLEGLDVHVGPDTRQKPNHIQLRLGIFEGGPRIAIRGDAEMWAVSRGGDFKQLAKVVFLDGTEDVYHTRDL